MMGEIKTYSFFKLAYTQGVGVINLYMYARVKSYKWVPAHWSCHTFAGTLNCQVYTFTIICLMVKETCSVNNFGDGMAIIDSLNFEIPIAKGPEAYFLH